jgi:uncharacterized protein YjbI with pentapeptide repeats
MANAEDIARAQWGKDVWNAWAEGNPGAEVDFTQETSEGIDFSGFVFPGAADFKGVRFIGDTNFIGATFEGHTNFLGAHFEEGAVHFNGATFLDEVVFAEARFQRAAVFSVKRFEKLADFRSARFHGEADFHKATFSDGLARFPSATFYQIVHFSGARFGKEGADFSDTQFNHRASFDEARSAGYANFQRARFNGEASFRSSKLRGLVAFNDAQFTTIAVFKDSTFHSVPTFHGAELHEDTTFEGVTWPKRPHEGQSPYDAVRAWARLRVEMSRLHKHEDELFFFAKELNARAQDRRNEPPAKRLLYRSYLALGAGRSVAKPLGWLLGLNAGLFLPIYWSATAAIQGRKVSIRDMLADAAILNIPADVVSFTLGQALPLIGSSNPERADLYRRLFAGGDSRGIDVPLWLESVGIVQQLVGIVLLFVIGLALRNRFRMK